MNDMYTGLLLTAAMICAVILGGWLLTRIKGLPEEVSRKFIHIGVSCFYFFYAPYIYGTELWGELLLPVVFLACNLFVALTGKPLSVSRAMSGTNKLGTSYYPLSIIILILLTRTDIGLDIRDLGAGVLVMGFGDGLAGMIGSLAGGKKISRITGSKTWVGSAVMLTVSFVCIVCIYEGELSFQSVDTAVYAAVAVFATLVEAFTPKGLDNLSVPLLTALLCMLVL